MSPSKNLNEWAPSEWMENAADSRWWSFFSTPTRALNVRPASNVADSRVHHSYSRRVPVYTRGRLIAHHISCHGGKCHLWGPLDDEHNHVVGSSSRRRSFPFKYSSRWHTHARTHRRTHKGWKTEDVVRWCHAWCINMRHVTSRSRFLAPCPEMFENKMHSSKYRARTRE